MRGLALTQLAQFGVEWGSQFVAAHVMDQGVRRLGRADFGV
jgi:hypothetical protein